jgi:tetratricopeptide (TPR) repeat protein
MDGQPEPRDATLAVAGAFAGIKYRQIDVPFDTPFADLRNLGLEEAARLGADWAVIIDTDERLLLNGFNVKRLDDIPQEVDFLVVLSDSGAYDKPRFFRLPAKGRFQFDVHEDYTDGGRMGSIVQVRFSELPKSEEQMKENLTIYLNHMEKQVEADPTNARWLMYKAWFLEDLGRNEESIACYGDAIRVAPDMSQGFIYFRLGWLLVKLGRYLESLMCALQGLAQAPEMPELHCLAGQACIGLGRPWQALAWSISAIAFRGSDRAGFREPTMFFEDPYQVRAAAYTLLEDQENVQRATVDIEEAKKERELFTKTGVPRG